MRPSPIVTDQDAYDLGYRNPAVPVREQKFIHVVLANAYYCGQLDAQNQQPRNKDYQFKDYDPGTFERKHPWEE